MLPDDYRLTSWLGGIYVGRLRGRRRPPVYTPPPGVSVTAYRQTGP